MGCDGIFDRYSNDYISEFIYQRIQEGQEPAGIVRDWLKKNVSPDNQTYKGGPSSDVGCDNQTAILIVFD